jgi:hypothetical protein
MKYACKKFLLQVCGRAFKCSSFEFELSAPDVQTLLQISYLSIIPHNREKRNNLPLEKADEEQPLKQARVIMAARGGRPL